MTEQLEVIIVGSDPIVAREIQELLAREPQPPACRAAASPAGPGAVRRAPDVLIVVPQAWQEMSRWLADLQRRPVSSRWLLRARLSLAGMFLSYLEEPPLCGIVSSLATPEQLLAEYRALTEGRPLCPPAALAAHLNAALRAIPGKERTPKLETRELECGCALSLGLSNAQIARALLLSTGTVKNSLTRLYAKLGVAGREEAGAFLEEAISAGSASP